MFGSEVLEIAIGLILVYLVLALVCTVVVEWIARILALRSKTLYKGIEALLDPNLAERLYEHPLIHGYARQSALLRKRPARPSYIPSHLFALALFQVLRPSAEETPPTGTTLPGAVPTTLEDLRNVVTSRPDTSPKVKRALLPLINQATGAKDELAKAQENVEAWFDNAMDRISGQYTRQVQLISLLVSLLLTGIVNADSFAIAVALQRDPVLRTAVTELAEQTAQDPAYQACLLATADPTAGPAPVEEGEESDVEEGEESDVNGAGSAAATPTLLPHPCDDTLAERLAGQVAGIGLPLGWSETDVGGRGVVSWFAFAKVFGLLFTVFAVSLGAPFWFDLLKRFTSIRAAGGVPDPTASTKSGTVEGEAGPTASTKSGTVEGERGRTL